MTEELKEQRVSIKIAGSHPSFSHTLIQSEHPFAEGHFARVYGETLNIRSPKGAKKGITVVRRKFKGTDPDYTEKYCSELKQTYDFLKRLGVKKIPGFYRVAWDNDLTEILMTDLRQGGDTTVISYNEKRPDLHIDKLANSKEFAESFLRDIRLISAKGIVAPADSYFFLLKNSPTGQILDFCIADYDNFPVVNYNLWKTNPDNLSGAPDLSEEESAKVYESNVSSFLSAFEASVVPLINWRETPTIREEMKKVLGIYEYLDFTR